MYKTVALMFGDSELRNDRRNDWKSGCTFASIWYFMWVFLVFFFFLFDQVKLQRFNGFRGCFVRVIRCIFAHSVTLYFCGCCYCCYSVGYSALSTIQIPVDFIEFPYDLVLHMHEQCGFYYFVHDSLPEKNHVFPKWKMRDERQLKCSKCTSAQIDRAAHVYANTEICLFCW